MALETASLAADEAVAAETESFLDSAKAEAPPRDGFRTALGLPAFRRLWLAQLLGQLGEAVALVAMPLFVYALTGSAELLSLIFVLQLLPRVVARSIAGMLADRLDRRRIILGMNLARAGLVAALPFTTQTWQIAVLATLVAIGNTIAQPAELAAVPAVVPPGLLVPALSASQVGRSVVRVVGPTLAAGIIAFTRPGPAFGVQAVCFLVAAGIVYGLVLPPVARQPRTTSTAAAMSQEILDGLHIVWRTPVVRGLAVAESLWQLVFASLVVTLLVYVQESLHLGDRAATTYSLLMAAFGGGAAVGALIARPVERRIGRPRLMAIGYLAPLTLMPALLTPPLPVLFACWLALGFTDSWAVIAMQTYLAEAVPDAMRGRVYATWFGVVTLAGAIAFFVIGWLTPRLGPPQTLALVGAVVGIGGPLLLLATGAVASLRHDAAAERRGPPLV